GRGTGVYGGWGGGRWVAARMGSDTPRALALAAAAKALALSPAAVIASADGSAYALAPLTEAERSGVDGPPLANAPAGVSGDIPDWLEASFARAFGGDAAAQGAGPAAGGPVRLRLNQ